MTEDVERRLAMSVSQSGHYLKPWLPHQKLSYLSYLPSTDEPHVVPPTPAELERLLGFPWRSGERRDVSLFTVPGSVVRRIGAIDASQRTDDAQVEVSREGLESCLHDVAQHLIKFGLVRKPRMAFRMLALPPGLAGLCGDLFEARTSSLLRLYGSDEEAGNLQDVVINVGTACVFVRWMDTDVGPPDPRGFPPAKSLERHPRPTEVSAGRLVRLCLASGEGIVFRPTDMTLDLDTLKQTTPAMILSGNGIA
jgi:hypothetical protein